MLFYSYVSLTDFFKYDIKPYSFMNKWLHDIIVAFSISCFDFMFLIFNPFINWVRHILYLISIAIEKKLK